MPTALSTTKRKFHRILDSISNASTTSLAPHHDKFNGSTATLPTNVDLPSKKARVARPMSAYGPPNTRTDAVSRNPTSRKASASSSRPATATTMDGERKVPNFAPWDRGQFLERLKTYRHVDKWMGKPDRISEVEWAKRGWSCVGRERVQCVGGCGREVVIKLEGEPGERGTGGAEAESGEEEDGDWREEAQEKLVERYADMISTAHDEGCLWRRRGCDDTIHRLPLANQAAALAGLRERYTSLTAMASDLPPTLSTPSRFEPSKITDLVSPLLTPPLTETPTPPNPTALTLALFGWTAEPSHISGLATCTACYRRLGLWLFQPPSSPSAEASMDRLDVVAEHRDYCPWINAVSQTGSGREFSALEGLAGWEVLVRAVVAGKGRKREEEGREEEGAGAGVAIGGDSEESGGRSLLEEAGGEEERASREQERASREVERDRERWAKLKKLKQVFRVRKGKGGTGAG